MNDDLTPLLKLGSVVGMVVNGVVCFVGIMAFLRSKNWGWLSLSAWGLLSLCAGVTAMFILEGMPGTWFALSGFVASGLLLLGVCLLAFPKKS